MNKSLQFSESDARDDLRRSASDMAALLQAIATQLQAEPGLLSVISQLRIDDALARHACVEQLMVTAAAANAVRCAKLHGLLETKALSALLEARQPDAQALITKRIAQRWLADAYRECARNVLEHFPDHIKALPQVVSARTH